MKRRDFILALGATATWPFVARAQQAKPVIGFLHTGIAEANARRLAGFHKGLREAGFVEGRNVAIEFRWAAGNVARLPEMAADLIRRNVAVIATPAAQEAALAAKAATTTIPIVFLLGGDPVELGLVASLNRPGGNATGITTLVGELAPKRLGLMRELLPQAAHTYVLANVNTSLGAASVKGFLAAAASLDLKLDIVHAGTDREIEAAFAALAQKPKGVLLLATDPFYYVRRTEIAALAARHGIPAIYDNRDFATAGGLISYGPDVAHAVGQAGVYVGRILKGEKPADLPVMQSTRIEMVLNLKAAKALGLDIPDRVLALADEVIE